MGVSKIRNAAISGVVGGYAPLNSNLLVPFSNLPAKVPTQVSRNVNSATPIVLTWSQIPVNKMFILTACTGTARAVSSITQTNVTWSSLRTLAGTDVRVEVWKGIPSGGTIGTTSSIAYAAGATNFDAAGVEWPDARVTGVLDSAIVDNSGASGANANFAANDITPTQDYALVLCVFCVANGTIPLQITGNVNRLGPQTPNFAVFGWAAPGAKIPLFAGVPVQTSAAWCNTLVSII